MLKVFDWCARAVMIAVTVIVIYRISLFFSPRPIDRYVHGGLIGSEQTETLFTGFATVPVLYFTKGRTLHKFDSHDDNGGIPEKPDGFCYRLYDLAIGYPNLRKTLEKGNAQMDKGGEGLPEPQVLAANAIEARHGGAVHRYDCDAIEFAPTEDRRVARLAYFQTVLVGNKQWHPHRENAHAILISLDEDIRRARHDAEKSASRKNSRNGSLEESRAERVRTAGISFGASSMMQAGSAPRSTDLSVAAPNGGALGSLKLTFSTIALFTRDKNWFFQKNEFYVRQDNAEVTYGVDFYHVFHATPSLIGPRRVTMTLPTPRILAIDRYSLALAAHPQKFNPAGKHKRSENNSQEEAPQDPIEKAITDELRRQIDRVDDHVIATSKGLITDQVRALMREQGANVVVRFHERGPEKTLELLKHLQDENS